MKSDSNIKRVLIDDGLTPDSLIELHDYENVDTINLKQLREKLGMGSWAVRIAYNKRFGSTIIQQQAGEGNRKHYHPDTDENWVILDGEWEWWIEGKGTKRVSTNSIVVVPKKTWHHIKCVKSPSVRYAITQPDVLHVYED
jgi:mannose-6-phosphate isomerase-like protein (cupin superfamily)